MGLLSQRGSPWDLGDIDISCAACFSFWGEACTNYIDRAPFILGYSWYVFHAYGWWCPFPFPWVVDLIPFKGDKVLKESIWINASIFLFRILQSSVWWPFVRWCKLYYSISVTKRSAILLWHGCSGKILPLHLSEDERDFICQGRVIFKHITSWLLHPLRMLERLPHLRWLGLYQLCSCWIDGNG